MFDLVISGGTVVTPATSEALDVAVQGERVAALGVAGSFADLTKETIDASGMYVLPGVVDTHIHSFEEWLGDKMPGFRAESLSAAYGGMTTFIDYGDQPEGVSLPQAHDEREALFTQEKAWIDFSVNAMISYPTWDTLEEIEPLLDRGVTNFKIFLSGRSSEPPEEAWCFAFMKRLAERGGVLSVHAEDASLCRYFTRQLLEQGKTGLEYLPHAKPALAEAQSVNRIIFLAAHTGAAVFFVHLCSAEAVSLIRQAQARGLPVYGETCPHYLLFNSDVYSQDDAFRFIRSPVIQDASNQAGLWEGVIDGTINSIGSDHVSAYLWRKRELAEGKPFNEIPGGMAQVETMLSVMYTEGVASGKFTVNRLVELMSANPSRIFGLYPKKGVIAPGSDADIVLYDPEPKRKITTTDLHTGLDYTVYEGWDFVGAPVMTMLRGEVVVRNGEVFGSPRGEFLRRSLRPEIFKGQLR